MPAKAKNLVRVSGVQAGLRETYRNRNVPMNSAIMATKWLRAVWGIRLKKVGRDLRFCPSISPPVIVAVAPIVQCGTDWWYRNPIADNRESLLMIRSDHAARSTYLCDSRAMTLGPIYFNLPAQPITTSARSSSHDLDLHVCRAETQCLESGSERRNHVSQRP